MLGWAITFFLVALVAAFFGFGGVAALSADIAYLLLAVFLVLLVAGVVVSGVRRTSKGRMP